MADGKVAYAWERYPEYIAAQQYSRFLGRVLASLPKRVQLRITLTLVRAATYIATGIAGAYAEPPAGEEWPREERDAFHEAALMAVDASRSALRTLQEAGVGSRPDIGAALELLERVESGLKTRPIPST